MANQDPPTGSKRRPALLLLTLLILLAGMLWMAWWWNEAQWREYTKNVQVGGNLVPVTSQLSADVVSVLADDTDRVAAGQVLVVLDDTDATVAVANARAQLRGEVSEVAALLAQRERALANLEGARSAALRAAADLHRRRGLIKQRTISAEELQHAEEADALARAAVAEATQAYLAANARVSGYRLSNHPRVAAAHSLLIARLLDLARTRVVAPIAGQVAVRSAQPGQRVAAGEQLLGLVSLNTVWANANFKEGQLRNLRVGQPAELTSDLYGPDVVFDGTVEGIGAGTGGVFALLPAQNATGNWIKIVQRVPVRIALQPEQVAKHPLMLGLSMEITVDTHDRDGPRLRPLSTSQARYQTTVFDQQLRVARREADRVLAQALQAAGQPVAQEAADPAATSP